MEWHKANQWKPDQEERVLLKIKHEDCPVVGYWGCGEWEACTVNLEARCCLGMEDEVVQTFTSEDVTHFAYISNIPN